MTPDIIKVAINKYCQEKHIEGLSLKTVMFDMDGVLFDSMPYHAQSWHRAMADFGLNLPVEEAFMHEGRTGAGTIGIVTRRQLNREATEEECKAIYQRKSQYFNEISETKRMPFAYETVKAVKECGIVPIVVTGSGQASLLGKLERNFPGLFKSEWMVCAKDVKLGKPNPEPYLMGMKKSGIAHEWETMVVENAPLGIEAGHKSGCFVVAVNTGPLPDEMLMKAGANLLFHSMKELSEWINYISSLSLKL